eukprot:TRINITY_DN38875_c0_g1_i1.p1 TRINITY_DN38875_c0_g1~~TRINITY_DN38875_c0_g1_i1.p1  ORF type:complete len:457 (-),score=48.07 TRINITY_DN38875_c0_g1_i1:68-1438(-)
MVFRVWLCLYVVGDAIMSSAHMCSGEQCDAESEQSTLLQTKSKLASVPKPSCTTMKMTKVKSNHSRRNGNTTFPWELFPSERPPSLVSLDGSSRTARSIPLLGYPYSLYNVDVKLFLGSVGEVTIPVQLDTGSAAFAVLGYDFCSDYYNGPCTIEGQADDSYIKGGWKAEVCAPSSSVIIVGQYNVEAVFGSIYEQSNFFYNCDENLGIAGASLPQSNAENALDAAPLWWTLLEHNSLQPVLGITCCKSGSLSDGGRVQLGGRDPLYYGQTVQTVPVISNPLGFWSIYMESLTIGSTTFSGDQMYGENTYGGSVQTIADTGMDTGFNFVPDVYYQVITEFVEALQPISGSACVSLVTLVNSFPTLSIMLQNNVELTFSGYDFLNSGAIAKFADEACVFDGPLSATMMVSQLVENYYLFISKLPENNNLGQGLQEAYYVEFNKEEMTLSFARQQGCP